MIYLDTLATQFLLAMVVAHAVMLWAGFREIQRRKKRQVPKAKTPPSWVKMERRYTAGTICLLLLAVMWGISSIFNYPLPKKTIRILMGGNLVFIWADIFLLHFAELKTSIRAKKGVVACINYPSGPIGNFLIGITFLGLGIFITIGVLNIICPLLVP